MIIKRIEIGTINDDFLKDRYTLKAITDDGTIYPLKIYKDGTVASFTDGIEYSERGIQPEFKEQILDCSNLKFFSGFGVTSLTIRKFVNAWQKGEF